MKYIVEKNVPILSYINPATLITDGLYTLYYYNSHERYFINISLLSVLSILFCFITYLNIRREKYASI
jgi:ABC-2 type transport system permease protein